MSINSRIQEMAIKFKELKRAELPVVKRMTIGELRQMAAETEEVMRKE